MKRYFKQNIIAIVYDFDGTLSPQPMQEYTVLPKLDIDSKKFWRDVAANSRETASESMLVYMRLLLEEAEKQGVHIEPKDFKRMAKQIEYFPGVEKWFDRINDFVKEDGKGQIKIKHYVISAGLKEILDGASIRKYFERIYASEYHCDHHKRATFPKVLITDTTKTQYIFRINKGKENLDQTINEHMGQEERRVPFSNIIYIGDGITDVPCMAVTKQNGGNTIAVHKKGSAKGIESCRKLLNANRANFIARADYSAGSELVNA